MALEMTSPHLDNKNNLCLHIPEVQNIRVIFKTTER
jgi:hypothetical protein